MQPDTDRSNDRAITLRQFAEMIGVKPKTFQNWLAEPDKALPKGFKLGSSHNSPRRWWESEATAWLQYWDNASQQRRRDTTGNYH